MADDDLDALRQQRLAQMQAQQNPELGGGDGGGADGKQAAEQRRKQQDEMRNALLSQALSQGARARLNTIAMAKPDKAQRIENVILQMAQYGRLQQKLDEDGLVKLIEQVNQQAPSQNTKVKFDRRRAALDSDED